MKIPIVVVLLCGIISVKGSPLENVQSLKTAVEPLSLESLEDSQSAADSVEVVDGPKIPEGLPVVHAQKFESVVENVGKTVVEKLPQRIDASAEKVLEQVNIGVAENVPEHVKGTVAEKVSEHETVAQSLVELEIEEVLPEAVKPIVKPAAESSAFESASPVEPILISSQVSRRVGPVELGVRNLVAASAVAAEELYLEMSAMNAETSHMIKSKSEILTAHTLNELYEPLNKIETEIKRSHKCGKGYLPARNMIFKDVDTNLRECTKSLTAIDKQYKTQNNGDLNSLSTSAEEIYTLTESCEIAANFAVGTFCIIKNLAEANDRVVSGVNAIEENNVLVKDKVQKGVASAAICQQNLVKSVNGKVNNLLEEIDGNCGKRKPSRS